MLYAIGDSLSDPVSSDNEEDGEDEGDDNEDTELGNMSKDDEPGWVMGTISKMVEKRMQIFRQKHMRLEEITQPGRGDVANIVRERDMEYGMADLRVPATVDSQTDMTAATPSLTPVG